jgi:hypothetical protein
MCSSIAEFRGGTGVGEEKDRAMKWRGKISHLFLLNSSSLATHDHVFSPESGFCEIRNAYRSIAQVVIFVDSS